MLDALRGVRGRLDGFRGMQTLGLPVDWLFHILLAAILVFTASRPISLRRAVLGTIIVILAKELIGGFGKSRLEYVRPPRSIWQSIVFLEEEAY